MLPNLAAEAAGHTCALRRIVDALMEGVDGTRHPGPVFNLDLVETRAKYIAAMRRLHADLYKLAALAAKNGGAAELVHRTELKTLQESLKRASAGDGPKAEGPAAVLAREPAPATPRRPSNPEPRAAQERPAAGPEPVTAQERPAASPEPTASGIVLSLPRTEGPKYGIWGGGASTMAKLMAASQGAGRPPPAAARASIAVGPAAEDPAVTLDAILVPGGLSAPREILAAVGPELHYIAQWGHFAVRVAGVVFHANAARIYGQLGPRRTKMRPERVRECSRAACARPAARRACLYYHDPEAFPGSTDARNFTAESFVYSPPALSPRGAGLLRRFGSVDHMEADLRLVSREEARLYMHQVAFEILMALVLDKYVLRGLGHH